MLFNYFFQNHARMPHPLASFSISALLMLTRPGNYVENIAIFAMLVWTLFIWCTSRYTRYCLHKGLGNPTHVLLEKSLCSYILQSKHLDSILHELHYLYSTESLADPRGATGAPLRPLTYVLCAIFLKLSSLVIISKQINLSPSLLKTSTPH